ncbi:MAG TPA: hypothetical protein VGX92_03245 [Pyrinomonadaceae bacterium]|jgi:hypothetical protein|nr:hypothetical protein [Pyrinomonadaceae bacterium]
MKHNKNRALYFSVIVAATFAAILAATLISNAQQSQQHQRSALPPTHEGHNHSTCPMMQNRDAPKESARADPQGDASSMAEMNMRGEKEMGFSQTQTTHHFLLKDDGGAIEVEVNDPVDTVTREHIRQHLSGIAKAFSAGDFDTPFAVHAQVPPGVPVMKELKAVIKYEYEETLRGGRVRISTGNSEALSAIHQFIRFQIREHRTGDPLE